MPRGEDGAIEHAIVKRPAVDNFGQPVDVANSNLLLNTREYDIEYRDGTIKTFTANLIAENI